MAKICLLGLQKGPKWPKMAKIMPKWPPKGSPHYCLFMASAAVHNSRLFRPFWARKRAKISPKMAWITYYWPHKWSQFCPKQPKNDSQMTPKVLYSCGQYYCTLFGANQVIFGWRKEWNQHKTFNFDNRHCMIFLLWTAITWLNFAQIHLPVPVLKTTKQGKHS